MANIPEKLTKPYNPTETEGEIYARWEESGYFNPDVCEEKGVADPEKESFSMVLPPPNVTGVLHMGSAMMLVIEDTIVRHARMSGRKTLWLPGTDSAAIATQAKVEKEIQKKEKKNRHDLGRKELLKRVDTFIEENSSTILAQLRAMGSSLDWSRYAYTMDDARNNAVNEAFTRMYDAGLIYRGNRVVNWDPKGQTVISDDEIVYEPREAKLYTFKYWSDFPISIATTRPETKVGDTAVAVHPTDERYKEYIGKEYTGEFAGKTLTIKIIADEHVDKEYGTGALGVTPAHSHADWELGQKNNLPEIQVVNEYAKMTKEAGPLVEGLKTKEAREKIAEWLRDEGLIENEEEIEQNVSTAERTGGIVEPLPKLQWFIDVDKPFILEHSEIPTIQSGSNVSLKEIMRTAVDSDAVKILPERFENTYYRWIENLRPWCISRQIWFGHRIPVWYRHSEESETEVHVGAQAPEGDGWEQDPDVLDTWFSSGLWTFSTLGWPKDTVDLKTFHPTTLIETAYDILFFWVARMILMSGFHMGQIPFKTVYIHGLVRDEKGRKISKSLGNNLDPMDVGEEFGTDAMRMSLLVGIGPGSDSNFGTDKVKAYKKFANKIWNASRFVLENAGDIDYTNKPELTETDTKYIDEFTEVAKDITDDLENYRLHLASEKVYHYFWHTFADVVIEETKNRINSDETPPEEKASAQWTLLHILSESLKLIHPFMPFITEEIWQMMPTKQREFLMIEEWPTVSYNEG